MTPAPKETEWERRKRRERERAAHVAAHGPGCMICGAIPKRGGLHQDHDHKTGETRGWLCHRCNRVMWSWVTVEWLMLAAMYLRDYEQRQAPRPEPCPVCGRSVRTNKDGRIAAHTDPRDFGPQYCPGSRQRRRRAA